MNGSVMETNGQTVQKKGLSNAAKLSILSGACAGIGYLIGVGVGWHVKSKQYTTAFTALCVTDPTFGEHYGNAVAKLLSENVN